MVVSTIEEQQNRVGDVLSDAAQDMSKVTQAFSLNTSAKNTHLNCEMFCEVIQSHPISKACFKSGSLEQFLQYKI